MMMKKIRILYVKFVNEAKKQSKDLNKTEFTKHYIVLDNKI